MIDLIAAATVGGFVGFFTCAVMTVGKLANGHTGTWIEGYNVGFQDGFYDGDSGNRSAHARATDRGNALQARIDRALAVETPKAAHGVRKMAAILRGEIAP